MSTDGEIGGWLDSLLRTPAPPEATGGKDVQIVRPGPAYTRYRLCYWAATNFVPLLLLAIVLIGLAGITARAGDFNGGGGMPLRQIRDGVTKLVSGLPRPARTMVTVALTSVVILILVCMVLKLILGFFLCQLDARRRWYVLGDRTLTVREGLVNVREMTFTYANIQDVRLNAGPLCRFLGIADVTVETAGGGSGRTDAPVATGMGAVMHQARLAGLSNAGEIRDALIACQHRWKAHGLGDAPPAPAEPDPTGSEILAGLVAEASALRLAAERLGGPAST